MLLHEAGCPILVWKRNLLPLPTAVCSMAEGALGSTSCLTAQWELRGVIWQPWSSPGTTFHLHSEAQRGNFPSARHRLLNLGAPGRAVQPLVTWRRALRGLRCAGKPQGSASRARAAPGAEPGSAARSAHTTCFPGTAVRRAAVSLLGQPRRGGREHRDGGEPGRADTGVSAAGGRPVPREAAGSPSSSVRPSLLRGAARSVP